MKKERIEMLIVAICLLLTIAEVKALGVTYPLPNELELLKGESGRFRFEIQNMVSPDNQNCTYDLMGFKKIEDGWGCHVLPIFPCNVRYEAGVGIGYYPFDVKWDSEPPITVNAGTIKTIYGTVTAPLSSDLGQYNLTIEVSCAPVTIGTGVTIENIRRVPFTVSIVSEHTKPIFENPEPPYNWTPIIEAILVVAIVAVVSLAYYILIHKKERR